MRRLEAEAREWSDKLDGWPDTSRVRTAGGILHDFYCGVERIFRLIATRLDQDLPVGPDWQVELLQRMGTGIDSVRPPVVNRETAQQLDEFLRFRHLFRNLYGFDLEWDRCHVFLQRLPTAFGQLLQRLAAFDRFLRTLQDEL